MFLTRALMILVRHKRIPGRIDTGKKQRIVRITPTMKRRALAQMYLEKENLELLENPWLTRDEERGHMTEKLRQKFIMEKEQLREDRMFKHRHMDQYLDHLNVSKKWE